MPFITILRDALFREFLVNGLLAGFVLNVITKTAHLEDPVQNVGSSQDINLKIY